MHANIPPPRLIGHLSILSMFLYNISTLVTQLVFLYFSHQLLFFWKTTDLQKRPKPLNLAKYIALSINGQTMNAGYDESYCQTDISLGFYLFGYSEIYKYIHIWPYLTRVIWNLFKPRGTTRPTENFLWEIKVADWKIRKIKFCSKCVSL